MPIPSMRYLAAANRSDSIAHAIDTEHRELVEGYVRKRTAALTAAHQELDALVTTVGDELRAPLRVIDGFSKFLWEHGPEQVAARAHQYLTSIAEAEQRIADVIDALMILSRLELAKMTRSAVDVREMLLQIADDLRAREPHRNVDVIIDPLPRIVGDHALLRQAFENLLANAFKFTRDQAVARIQIGYFAENDQQIVLFVRDNGVGFDMRDADRLFGLFERLHCREKYEGTGIGLAMVRRIIHRHGGRVWADGEPGMGATLYVAFPQDDCSYPP